MAHPERQCAVALRATLLSDRAPYSILAPLSLDFLNPQEPLDGGRQLFYLPVGVFALLYGLPDAVLDVILEQDRSDPLKGRDDAAYLGENVHAIRLFVHHPLQAAHLPLDAPETVLQLLLISGLDVAVLRLTDLFSRHAFGSSLRHTVLL